MDTSTIKVVLALLLGVVLGNSDLSFRASAFIFLIYLIGANIS